MKKILFALVMLIAGVAVGGGAGYGAILLLGPPAKASAQPVEQKPPVFVPGENILAPLVFSDGRLAGYVKFDIQLEVAEDQVAMVTAKMPFLLHAINMKTWRTPLATGPDGLLANIEGFRKVAADASIQAFGPHVVKRVAITRAEPA